MAVSQVLGIDSFPCSEGAMYLMRLVLLDGSRCRLETGWYIVIFDGAGR